MDFDVGNAHRQATFLHTLDVAKPTQMSLPHNGDEVMRTSDMQDGVVRVMIPLRYAKDGTEASEVYCVVACFVTAVWAPRLTIVLQDARGVDSDREFDCKVVNFQTPELSRLKLVNAVPIRWLISSSRLREGLAKDAR